MEANTRATGMSLRGIIRDSDREIHASHCYKLNHVYQPKVVEALVVRKIMIICYEFGISRVIFEGDYQVAI